MSAEECGTELVGSTFWCLNQRCLARPRRAKQHVEMSGEQGHGCRLDMRDGADALGHVVKFDHLKLARDVRGRPGSTPAYDTRAYCDCQRATSSS